jgi:hypothetical protein
MELHGSPPNLRVGMGSELWCRRYRYSLVEWARHLFFQRHPIYSCYLAHFELEFPGTFGEHGIKGALYSGSVCYFINGANYIRVHRGLEGAGYVDTGYPRAIKDAWGWPDGFGANSIDAALYSGSPLVPQPTPGPCNNGNNNYFLWDNGNPLPGVQATVNTNEAFINADQGFSFQLNFWSQGGANFIPNWQQFIWGAQGGTVLGANLDFFIAPNENNKHGIIRLKESLATVPIPTTIGQGYQLQWALTYNGNSITGCIFTAVTNIGATLDDSRLQRSASSSPPTHPPPRRFCRHSP